MVRTTPDLPMSSVQLALVLGLAMSLAFFISAAEKDEAWIDAKNFTSFSAAVEAAAGKTLVISRAEKLDKDTVIPANIHLLFLKGGSIVKSANYTLRIEGPVTAPLMQIFSGFSPKEVTFGLGSVKEVYPQWWGAKGDGIKDDTQAIQAAVDSNVALVHLPKGTYLVNKPINLTNRAFGLTLQGQGMSEAGTIIVGNTGGIVIDATGSRYLHFEDFRIASGETNPSTVGILFARSSTIEFAEFNNLQNVAVHLKSIRTANGGNGTVGLYNCAAELWRARNIYIAADNPVVFTGYNIFNIESPFVKHQKGYVSMSECTIDGASTLHAFLGAAVTFENAIGIEVLNAYLTRSGELPDSFPYAIKVIGFWARTITYTGHVEGFQRILYTNATIIGLNLRATIGPGKEPLVYLEDADKGAHSGIIGGTINIIPINHVRMVQTEQPVIQTGGKHAGISNTTIYLYGGQRIYATGGGFSGNIIYAAFENPSIICDTKPKPPSYILFAPGGIKLYGKMPIQ